MADNFFQVHMNEPQKCFVNEDGYRLCNYVFKNGIPTYTKSGKWWKWFVGMNFFKQNKKASSEKDETLK